MRSARKRRLKRAMKKAREQGRKLARKAGRSTRERKRKPMSLAPGVRGRGWWEAKRHG